MRLPRRRRRASATAALLAFALATSLAVQADASPSTVGGRPVAAAAEESLRQPGHRQAVDVLQLTP